MDEIDLGLMVSQLKDLSPVDIMNGVFDAMRDGADKTKQTVDESEIPSIQKSIDVYVKKLSDENLVLAKLFEWNEPFRVRYDKVKGIEMSIPVWLIDWLSSYQARQSLN